MLSHNIQNSLRSAKHPAFCPGRARRTSHGAAHHARFYRYRRPFLLTLIPTHQSKPIGHTPCSGLVQNIFSSPGRLRSSFPSAYSYCRRTAELKMLCIEHDSLLLGGSSLITALSSSLMAAAWLLCFPSRCLIESLRSGHPRSLTRAPTGSPWVWCSMKCFLTRRRAA